MADDKKRQYELRPVSEEETYFRKLYRMVVGEICMELEAKQQEEDAANAQDKEKNDERVI